MTILFLTNNYEVTESLIKWLESNEEQIIVYGKKLSLTYLNKIKPDLMISYNYIYLLKEDVLKFIKYRAINLHISLLPWNKGIKPNLWSFLENTPKGVTVHLMNKGLDTGDILLQKELYFDEKNETLGTSYKKLHQAIQRLFINNWNNVKNFNIKPIKQKGKGTIHTKKDFDKVKDLFGKDIWNMKIDKIQKQYLLHK